MQRLSSRLETAARFCRDGARIADIGTDHAYLPISLVGSHRAAHAVATDIAEGPLGTAAGNVRRAGLDGYIELRLGDGLSVIDAHDADDIFICGMGGLAVSEMIMSAPWLREGKRLILQPMTKVYELRKRLFSEGFSVLEERAVCDAGKVYTVICAEYTGRVCGDVLSIYTGRLNVKDDPCARLYLEKVYRDVSSRILGAAGGEARELTYVKNSIRALLDE